MKNRIALGVAWLLAALLTAGTVWARGGGGCFLPETPILRADGATMPISAVRPGQQLLAFEVSGNVVTATVHNVIIHDVDEYCVVKTGRVELRVTLEHPFYVGDGTFKILQALRPGDTIFAFNGAGLTPQVILSIARIRQPTRVYNLQTDAPNTYFANGIAVHNKGGGGGGHGGGGFSGGGYHGGGYHGGGGSGGSGDPRVMLVIIGAVVIIVIITKIREAQDRTQANLDFCYSPSAVEGKAGKTRTLLEFIARTDTAWSAQALGEMVSATFTKLQQCWQAREYEPMKPLLISDLYAQHCAQLQGMRRNHEINLIANLRVERVQIVNVRYTHVENQREFTALITATARDYYVDDRTQQFQRGDAAAAQFQEFWTFQRHNGAWLLREIEQSRESDKLKEENFFEQFTDTGVGQVYGATADATGPAGPWLEKDVETKATRIERLLNFLVQTDKLWEREAMLARARKIFLDVMLAREAGDPTAVTDDEIFPATAVDLRRQIAQTHSRGLRVENRNLCIRKAELILVRNFTDNTKDEFTVRISAHVQKIVRQNGVVVSQDDDVVPFLEYWTFGRLAGQWKLKEVLPPAQGEADVAQENVDEDSNAAQLQWYYQHPRAN